MATTLEPQQIRIIPDPANRFSPFPLTHIQHAYWIGRRQGFELGGVSAHAYFEYESSDPDFNLARFEGAWRQLIARHDMLRAVIRPDGQQQVLSKVPAYEISIQDLRSEPHPQRVVALERVREEMSHQLFPSDQWPLFELRASRLSNQLTRLHFSFDALLGDAASWIVIMREWKALYEGAGTTLAPLQISFRDYVLSLEQAEQSEAFHQSAKYWQERIPKLPSAPPLPLAKKAAEVSQPRFVRRSMHLGAKDWALLKDRGMDAAMTSSGTLLAAFAVILANWSSHPQFTLNLPLFHRIPLHPQVSDLVGDFSSLTLLEVNLQGGQSFKNFGEQLQERLWQDMEHHSYSGVSVLRELARAKGDRTGSMMPIVFTSRLETASSLRESATAWLGKQVYGISQTPQVWLDVAAWEDDGCLTVDWDAVDELFPPRMLDEMFEEYAGLVKRLAEDESAWHKSCWGLLPARQRQQRQAYNTTAAPLPQGLLHEPFLRQAQAHPQQEAVISGRRRLSYGELARRSRQVGHWLRQQGAGRNRLVGVVMEKGWEQVVAVLGVLQAGAAYLPIDPSLPAERVEYLLQHGQVEWALTQSRVEAGVRWPAWVKRLVITEQELPGGEEEGRETLAKAEDQAQPEDLAYVIYTSGSTGQPKGVMITHRAALNTIVDINERFAVTSADRVLALSSLSFDLSVYDIFGVLAAGGSVVLPEAGAGRNPGRWLELLQAEGVTLWNTVPALMEMLIEYAAGRVEEMQLRLVLLSGDWIPVSLPRRIGMRVPGAKVISLGGATEAAIWSILYPIEEVEAGWESIPYGWPMRNQQFHVLNEGWEACPEWVTGPLYIGGVGLAEGYWRDEEKTRHSFVVHPRTGERLYRTGDVGRFRPEGYIEFLGREDFQVKVHGHRIELGEIEAALGQHKGVQAALVAAVGERTHKRLVAYIVPTPEYAASTNAKKPPSQQLSGDDVQHYAADGVILDPLERLEFKLKQSGLREEAGRSFIGLPDKETSQDNGAGKTYGNRFSCRHYLNEPVSLKEFGAFLSCLRSVDVDGLPKYKYGSAGGLYPVQAYVYVKPGRIEGIAGGTYYYHPKTNRLVFLEDRMMDASFHFPINQLAFTESSFSIFLIAQLRAIQPMYGRRSQDFCLIETGLMTQLLESSAAENGLALCQIGELRGAERIFDYFTLDNNHLLLHSLVGGKPAPRTSLQPPTKGRGTAEELRSFLEQKLPNYMVPSAFVLLEKLPLSANGKVDRNALPSPDAVGKAEKGYLPPSTETEKTIAGIFERILNVAQVGIHDNFFDLGADSVKIVQAHSQLQQALGREFPLIPMFEHSTISALAKYLSQATESKPSFETARERARKQQDAMSGFRKRFEKDGR